MSTFVIAAMLCTSLMSSACTKQPIAVRIERTSSDEVRHYHLLDRAEQPVAGAPRYLNVEVPLSAMDTNLFPAPAEGEVPVLFVSLESSWRAGSRFSCRMTYSSPGVSGAVADDVPIDPSIAPRFGLPPEFECRMDRGYHQQRYAEYHCEVPAERQAGRQLETHCRFGINVPAAMCLLSVRTASHAYLDCSYPVGDAHSVGAIAADIARNAENLIHEPVSAKSHIGDWP